MKNMRLFYFFYNFKDAFVLFQITTDCQTQYFCMSNEFKVPRTQVDTWKGGSNFPELGLRLHGSGRIWNRSPFCTIRPCVYTEPTEPDEFEYG